jgi:hypothetical protein
MLRPGLSGSVNGHRQAVIGVVDMGCRSRNLIVVIDTRRWNGLSNADVIAKRARSYQAQRQAGVFDERFAIEDHGVNQPSTFLRALTMPTRTVQ